MFIKKEIIKLAFLSRIELDEEAASEIPGELDSILNYIQKLTDVDTQGVEPLFHFPELKNVVRSDISEEGKEEIRNKMMAMGKKKDGYLKVESIL